MKNKQVQEIINKIGDVLPKKMRILWSAGVNGAMVIAIGKQPKKKP